MDTGNPQQMNGYAYAGNSPITFSDPSGQIIQMDGHPAYVSTAGVTDPAELARANAYNDAVRDNWAQSAARHEQQANYEKTHPHQAKASGGSKAKAAPHRSMWDRLWDRTRHIGVVIGKAAYEFSGAEDLVDGCILDPNVVGCITGVVEVGSWFVPAGGLAVRGAEAVLLGGRAIGRAAVAEARVAEEAVVTEAGAADEVAASCKFNSFAGDTPVLMADGSTKPIEEVKVGDKILNADPDSSDTEVHTVTDLHITDTDHDFVDVTIATPDGPTELRVLER